MRDFIELRGHHLFCLNVTDMTGDPIYNPKFCDNFRKYQAMIESDPDLVIKVVGTCGDTCLYCPSWVSQDHKCLLYDYELGANWIDLHLLEALGWKIGEERTVRDLRRRISEVFQTLPEMCHVACPFQHLLNCAEGLSRLKKEAAGPA